MISVGCLGWAVQSWFEVAPERALEEFLIAERGGQAHG